MDKTQLFRYYDTHSLDQRGSIIAEYIWIDGTGLDIRGKAKTITKPVT
jgi:glutamine synthetase